MKRNVLVGAVVVAAIVAVVLARCGGRAKSSQGTHATTGSAGTTVKIAARDKHVDPRKLPRASISGTVTDAGTKAPLAGARVCGDATSHQLSPQLVREPACATTDARGMYTLTDLVAAGYNVVANAPTYRPGMFQLADKREPTRFVLAPGETRTGIDVQLRPGGVLVTGTVSDATGGPIAQALVRASPSWDANAPPVETDTEGRFSLWTAPGRVLVRASAEGYALGADGGRAPGTFDIRLTPESSLAGTVIDAATGQPVPGVFVNLDAQDASIAEVADPADITDEQGAFRIARLTPGRYSAFALSAHGYGRGDGTTLVGLGQHVEGVVIRLHPGVRVSGRVIRGDKTVCKHAQVSLTDERGIWARTRTELDGQVYADGVLPGTYAVEVLCRGSLTREKYESISVTDKDILDLVWSVDSGAAVRGRVLDARGEPVDGATVSIYGTDSAENDVTAFDGTYLVSGLPAGSLGVTVKSDHGIAARDQWKVELAANETLEKELVLSEGGSITGSIVDTHGKPVGPVAVYATSKEHGSPMTRSAPDGTFVFVMLAPGEYRITATRGRMGSLRKPGSTEETPQSEKVTVTAAKATTVKLVVEAQSGRITGTVLGINSAPVPDAYVITAREFGAAGATGNAANATRWSDLKPVITAVDGTFTVSDLATGLYTIRATLRGGGEVIAEHVPVGAHAKLQLRATGTIAGTATTTGGPIQDLRIELSAKKTGFWRQESFFRTNGAFSLRDLPAGSYTLTATSAEGKQQLEIELAEGESKTNVVLTFAPLVTITGRVVDAVTKQPIAGITMTAALAKGGTRSGAAIDDTKNTTANDGRFTIERAPSGAIRLSGLPREPENSAYLGVFASKQIAATGPVDVGDIIGFKRRLDNNQKPGDIGFNLGAESAAFKVTSIDPEGPAANSGLVVGDVMVSVDGHSIVNDHSAWTLAMAPPGTKLVFGLERGATVTIVLAAPK